MKLDETSDAHRAMEAGEVTGKLVLVPLAAPDPTADAEVEPVAARWPRRARPIRAGNNTAPFPAEETLP
jgi:hypothetical protein